MKRSFMTSASQFTSICPYLLTSGLKMRFRFVGGLDCPDWLLSAIAVLSKLTSVKFKLLCTSVVRHAINDSDWQVEETEKFAREPAFADSEDKFHSCIAALDFILVSAARNRCSAENLSDEMQQLGLPPEHAQQLHKCFAAHETLLIERLSERIPKAPAAQPDSINTASHNGSECQVLTLSLDDASSSRVSVALTQAQLGSLKKELTEALTIAKSYEEQKS